jgi:hypothetical protein
MPGPDPRHSEQVRGTRVSAQKLGQLQPFLAVLLHGPFTGMHGPARIFWANLTPFSLKARVPQIEHAYMYCQSNSVWNHGCTKDNLTPLSRCRSPRRPTRCSRRPQGSVALSLCTTAHPLHTIFVNISVSLCLKRQCDRTLGGRADRHPRGPRRRQPLLRRLQPRAVASFRHRPVYSMSAFM